MASKTNCRPWVCWISRSNPNTGWCCPCIPHSEEQIKRINYGAVPARPPADVPARRRCLHPTFWSSAVGRMSGAFQSGMIAGCLPRCQSGKTPWTNAFHRQRQVPAVSSPTFLAAADTQTVADVGHRPNNYLHYKLQWPTKTAILTKRPQWFQSRQSGSQQSSPVSLVRLP